jgi:hypothetical protein
MKTISCGVFITDGVYVLTGKVSRNDFYDIPKGIGIEFETDIQTVIRETHEEFNIDLTGFEPFIKDIGEFNYRFDKNLHLYILKLDYLNLQDNVIYMNNQVFNLQCNTTFDLYGTQVPEIESYKLVKVMEFNKYACNSMRKLLLNNGVDVMLLHA